MTILRFLLPLFVLTAESHIMRLPCTWDGDFKQVKNKRYSPNYSISNVTANTWSDCCVYCVANSNCTLANYETDDKSCELIQDSISYDADKIAISNSWMILTTKYGSRYRGEHCMLHQPCDVFQICKDICTDPYYECVTLNNIALLKKAYQSSDYSSSYTAELGVDGDFSTLTWTLDDEDPWWYVDLNDIVEVQFVTVYSGGVTFETKVSIGMDNTDPKNNVLCTTIVPDISERISYECVNGVLKGRYVYLYSDSGEFGALYFYQLEVYVA